MPGESIDCLACDQIVWFSLLRAAASELAPGARLCVHGDPVFDSGLPDRVPESGTEKDRTDE